MFLNNRFTQLVTIIILITIIINCTSKNNSIKKGTIIQNIDITNLLDSSKTKTLSIGTRKSCLIKAYKLTEGIQNDSIKKHKLLKISSQAYKLKDLFFFKLTNDEAYVLSKILKDTLSIAKTHWNNGLYYSKKEALDSSFYHYHQANNYYKLIKHENNYGKMLYGMAIIQSKLKDFIGSETNIFKAISIFKETKNYKSIFKCYSLLGNIYKEIDDYKISIEHFEKSFEYLGKVKNKKTYKEGVYNNIALNYQKQGKYIDAITNFNTALSSDSLYFKNISLYTRLRDNLAYTRFLSGDNLNVEKELLSSLKIRDNANNTSGVVINSLHLAEYYLTTKDTIKALSYAKNAHKLAEEVNNNRDILASLSLLSAIDRNNANHYFHSYQKLNNELQLKERNLRNKFARIRFETDEYIEEADKQSYEKLMVAAISTAIIVILLLLYFVRHQRGKNRELILEGEQQRSNESIYSLLLQQQAKLEEGRLNERHRISQELHDGLLGKIFATRMRLDFLDIEGNAVIQEKFQLYLGELQEIEKEMRVISHELKNELLSSKADYTQIITHLIAEQSNIANFKYKIDIEDTVHWSLISDVIKINCYRVIQEALQNIIKYAKATQVSVSFSFKDNTLVLNIQDNGVGFDSSKNNKGIGLQNITARIKKLKGTFVITSSLEQGALLTIRIPVTELKAAVKPISK